MIKSTYHISQMDCPSEENLIRMKLDGLTTIKKLEFQIEKRTLIVFHNEHHPKIAERLMELNLGAKLQDSVEADAAFTDEDNRTQRSLLWAVLAINFGFFAIEIIAGLWSGSMGLVADSIDMLADAVVYGLALWAIGAAVSRKKSVATLSGYFQITLAAIGLAEVVRRFIGFEAMPDFRVMIGISILALVANAMCLYLLQKSKSQEVHMKATMIFTSNDIIINAGVILAGVLVLVTKSNIPDLVVGAAVFAIVARGAIRILKLSK